MAARKKKREITDQGGAEELRLLVPPPTTVSVESAKKTQELMQVALGALKELLAMFRVERFVYLVVAALAFVLFVYSAFKLISDDNTTRPVVVSFLGGSGLATLSAARVSYFLNRGFSLIEGVLGSNAAKPPSRKVKQ